VCHCPGTNKFDKHMVLGVSSGYYCSNYHQRNVSRILGRMLRVVDVRLLAAFQAGGLRTGWLVARLFQWFPGLRLGSL